MSPATKKPSTSGWRHRISNKPSSEPTKPTKKVKPLITSQYLAATAKPEVKAPIQNLVVVKVSEPEDEPRLPPVQQKFTNPLDFILMKEEYVKKNPPAKKTLVKQRDLESDSEGEMSMESVMKSLKKIVKAINPKREFSSDQKEKEKQDKLKMEMKDLEKKKRQESVLNKPRANRHFMVWDERMRKYYGANIVPFNSHAARWNSCQDLVEEQRIIDKKAVRERIKNRVLSSVHQALENRIDVTFCYCESKDFTMKGGLNILPSKYKLSRHSVEQEDVTIYECVEFRKRELPDIIAQFSKDKEKTKKKSLHVKPTIHGLTDAKTERYVYALITRTNDLWETVKPINVAVKIKTELFAPKSSPIVKGRAKVSFNLVHVAITTSPGTSGTTAVCDQHKWDDIKGCALFSVVGIQICIKSTYALN